MWKNMVATMDWRENRHQPSIFPWRSWRSWGVSGKISPLNQSSCSCGYSPVIKHVNGHLYPFISMVFPATSMIFGCLSRWSKTTSSWSLQLQGCGNIENHWKPLKVIASVQYSTRLLWILWLLLTIAIIIITINDYHCHYYYYYYPLRIVIITINDWHPNFPFW